MELAPHLEKLRADLAAAAAVGGEDVATAARLLGDAVEPALRLVLLDLLTEAAEDLSAQLGTATVEVRLHGREPELVAGAQIPMPPNPPAPPAEDGDSGVEDTVRITLRLPENLKNAAEAAAAGANQSLNGWLVGAVHLALDAASGALHGFPSSWAFGPGRFRGPQGPRGPQFPPGFPFPPGGVTINRRVTGYGRA